MLWYTFLAFLVNIGIPKVHIDITRVNFYVLATLSAWATFIFAWCLRCSMLSYLDFAAILNLLSLFQVVMYIVACILVSINCMGHHFNIVRQVLNWLRFPNLLIEIHCLIVHQIIAIAFGCHHYFLAIWLLLRILVLTALLPLVITGSTMTWGSNSAFIYYILELFLHLRLLFNSAQTRWIDSLVKHQGCHLFISFNLAHIVGFIVLGEHKVGCWLVSVATHTSSRSAVVYDIAFIIVNIWYRGASYIVVDTLRLNPLLIFSHWVAIFICGLFVIDIMILKLLSLLFILTTRLFGKLLVLRPILQEQHGEFFLATSFIHELFRLRLVLLQLLLLLLFNHLLTLSAII